MKSTIQQRKSELTFNQMQIIDLLKWTEDQYTTHLHNSGLEYLRHYCGDDTGIADYLEKKKEFWNWYRNHYDLRNEAFLQQWDCLENVIGTVAIRELYLSQHNPEMLVSVIAPPSFLFDKEFVKHYELTAV